MYARIISKINVLTRERERESKRLRRFVKFLFSFLFFVTFFFAAYSSVYAETYYMRADGSATKVNSSASASPTPGSCGTASTAMNVATHNGSTFLAGDTIYLCDNGGSFTTQITAPSSGNDDTHRITYDAAPGASPVINLGGTVNMGFWIFQKSYITVRNIIMQNPLSVNGVFVIQGTGTTTNNNIGEYLTLSSNAGTVAFISGNNAANNILRHSTVTASNIGITMAVNAQAPYSTIDNVTVINTSGQKDTGVGIMLGSNGTVENSHLGRTSSEAFFTGIQISGSNSIIQNSEIAYSWNELPYSGGGVGYGIRIYTAGSSNNIVRYNKIHDNQRGYLEDATVTGAGNNSVYYNIFYNNTTNDIDFRYPGSTGYSMAYNNTIIHHIDLNGHIGHGIVVQNGGTRAKIFNNLITVDQYVNGELIQGVELAHDSTKAYADVQLSNNLYYVINGAIFGSIFSGSAQGSYTDFSSWVNTGLAGDATVTVKETGSQQGNPAFLNASSNDYHLTATSPAINGGVSVGLTTDYAGNLIVGAPDIGAYEYIPPSSSSSTLSSTSSPSCGNSITAGIPDLFEIRTNKNTATLYFAPPTAPYSSFYIAYSRKPDLLEYGVEYNQNYSGNGGVLKYTIGMLQPNTKYYFKIRAGNGCATGNWGNTMSATTTSSTTQRTYYKNFPIVINNLLPRKENTNSPVTSPNPSSTPTPNIEIPTPIQTTLPSQTQPASTPKFCILWWCF